MSRFSDQQLLAAGIAVTSERGREATLRARDLSHAGLSALRGHYEALPQATRSAATELADDLDGRGIRFIPVSDDRYPRRLAALRTPPPYLFVWGNAHLLDRHGVGMCGSRHATERGLSYARVFGREVAQRGLQVISGYAKGVDMETHLGALEAGGSTLVVLAEGIKHFRVKRDFKAIGGLDPERAVVVSQFPATQPWSAGAAMTRNGVIVALSKALLVVEAGERGGTLNAGEQALGLGRTVFAIDYQDDPPPGNQVLLTRGARPLRSKGELAAALDALVRSEFEAGQMKLRV